MKFAFIQKDPEAEALRKKALLSESMRQHLSLRHRETGAALAKRVQELGRPDGPCTPEERELAAKCALLRGEKPLSGKRQQGKPKAPSPQREARQAAHQALLAAHAARKAAKATRVAGLTLLPEALVWRRLRQLRLRVSGYRQAPVCQRLPPTPSQGPRIHTSHWTRARLATLLLPSGEES